MDGQFAPQREGTRSTDQAERGPGTHALRVGAASSLRSLSGDYAFFNHACFFTWGGLDIDPVGDFLTRHPDRDCTVFHVEFRTPVLGGIAKPGRLYQAAAPYEYRLYGIPRPYWPNLKAELSAVSMVDRRLRRYHRAVTQDLTIVDPLALDRLAVLPATPPLVDVTLFGVDGTHHHALWRLVTSGAYPRAVVQHQTLSADSRRIADAILAGHSRPLHATQPEPKLESRFSPPQGL